MNRYEFILSLLQIVVGTLITLVCVYCGFVLFRAHVEGGAYFLGMISGTPAGAALGYTIARTANKDKPTPPVNINATAQAGDTPDASSVSVSTSAPDNAQANSQPASGLPLAFSMPALVDKDGNKLP